MKIAITTNYAMPFTDQPIGGAEKFLFYMALKLKEDGNDVTIFTKKQQNYSKKNIYCGIEYEFFPPRLGLFNNFRYLQEIAFSLNLSYSLKKENYDMIISFFVTPVCFFSKKLRNKLIYYPFYDWFFEVNSLVRRSKPLSIYLKIKYTITDQIQLLLAKIAMHNASIVLTEGKFQIDEMIKKLSIREHKLVNFGVGVDIERIKELALNNCKSRSQLNISEEAFVLFTSNRLVEVKGIDILIKAMEKVCKEISNAYLIIVGTGPLENEYNELIRRLDLSKVIRMTGKISEDELYSYMNIIDLYISPTFHKDWVLGIGEAMALNKPVLSTGQGWLVKENINGFLVEKGNPDSIANGVIKFYNLSQEGKNCYKRNSYDIICDYDVKKLAKNIVNILN